jgi:hypothetical protein
MNKKYVAIGIVAIIVLVAAGYAAWYSFERHEKIARDNACAATGMPCVYEIIPPALLDKLTGKQPLPLVPPSGCDQASTTTDCAGSDQYTDAILACYNQNPGSDANKPIPNNSVQNVKETSRMFINMPKDLYPQDISRSWTSVSGNATGGYVSNGGLSGEAYGATQECWSTYVDFEGSGEVDLRVKSLVEGVPDYVVRFIVSPV